MRPLLITASCAVLGLAACGDGEDDLNTAPPEPGEGAAGIVEPAEVPENGDPAYPDLESNPTEMSNPPAEGAEGDAL